MRSSLMKSIEYHSRTFLLIMFVNMGVSTAPCEMHLSVEIQPTSSIENGTLLDEIQGIEYPLGTYFTVDGENGTVYRACPCKINSRPCLRKCCPLMMSMNKNKTCLPNENVFVVNVTSSDMNERVVDGKEHFALITSIYCPSKETYFLNPKRYFEDKFFIRASDGILTFVNDNSNIGVDDFCLEYFHERQENRVLMCNPEDFNDQYLSRSIIRIVYPITMIISIPPLLATFLVYTLIQELRNFHGKCLVCYLVCLIFTYITLSVVHLGTENLSSAKCVYNAFLLQFMFIATFFWLNAMCFDTCVTFCHMQPLPEMLMKSERKKFIYYSIYAWGGPLAILIISIVMDYAPGIPENYIKPRFGRSRCWFDRKIDALTYFYGPVAILLTSNLIMFIITAYKIVKLKREEDVLRQAGAKSFDTKENQHRFKLYMKLLIVMGLNWIAELISWAVEGPSYLWYITDFGNCLQGIFVFIIFVWQKKIRKLAIKKFIPCKVQRHDNSVTKESQLECNTTRQKSIILDVPLPKYKTCNFQV